MLDQSTKDKFEKRKLNSHIKAAWVAVLISAGFTLILSLVGHFNDSFRFTTGIDGWALFDMFLLLGLAYGVYCRNRFAAVTLLVYFIVAKIAEMLSSSNFYGLPITLLFSFLYIRGAHAIFKWHKLKEAESEDLMQSNSILKKYLKWGAAIVVIVLVSWFLIVTVQSPAIEVIPGKQLDKKYEEFIRSEKLISQDESIEFWYSDVFGDFKDGFYFFTNQQVVLYCQQWAEPKLAVPFDEISFIEFKRDSSFIEDSRITLHLTDHSTVFFPVSSEHDGDTKFYDRLNQLWLSSKP